MTIKQVFKRKYKFPNIAVDKFYVGIFLGILTTVTMYLFFTASREILRVMFSASEDYDLWILTDKETWFYNLVFAFISSNLGQGICFKTWFESPNRIFFNSYFNFKKKIVYNESMFFNVNFLNVFAKLAVVYAIWFGENYVYLNYKTEIVDLNSETRWDIRGKYIIGLLNVNLEPIAISDEYWFSWKKFHNDSKIIRLK